jgi:hypothetical protein
MADFDDRRDVAEKEFAFQEKHSFDVEARTCKIFGRWVAEKLGLAGADVDTYAMTVVEANLEEPGFDDVLRKVSADFDQKGIAYERHDLCERLDESLAQARIELSKQEL